MIRAPGLVRNNALAATVSQLRRHKNLECGFVYIKAGVSTQSVAKYENTGTNMNPEKSPFIAGMRQQLASLHNFSGTHKEQAEK